MSSAREKIISESKSQGGMFLVIPSVVMMDDELPTSAKMLYGVITWKCGENACTWISNRSLGEVLNLSIKRVSALLSLLEERGHIETVIECKEKTKEIIRRLIYPIVKSARKLVEKKKAKKERATPKKKAAPPLENRDTPSPQEQGDPPPKNEDTPPLENRDTPSLKMRIPLPENAEEIYKNKYKIYTPPYSPPKGDAQQKRVRQRDPAKLTPDCRPERFEQFWAAFPGGGSKAKAAAAWDALKPDDDLIWQMAAALKQQKATRQWQMGIGIPHASTWLINQRWTDKPPEAAAYG